MRNRKKFLQYIFLIGLIVVISAFLPRGIKYLSGKVVDYILEDDLETESELSTEIETEQETEDGDTRSAKGATYSIGNPELYVEKEAVASGMPEALNPGNDGGDPQLAERYEKQVEDYENYVNGFTPEYAEEESGTMKRFLSGSGSKFYQTAAAYSYARWGSDRKITRVEFGPISEMEDGSGSICMISFYHTSHPDTENPAMVFCIYNKDADAYSFT